MFTKEDYLHYFDNLELSMKKTLVTCTDLLLDLSNASVKNSILVISKEDMESFKFIKEQREKLTP